MQITRFNAVLLAVVSMLFIAMPTVRGGNWPQWRGPFQDGSTTEERLPETWSTTNGVAWAAPLPGFSGATPAVWNNSIFVSSPDTNKDLLLICLDRATGAARWKAVVGTGDREVGRNNMAAPSPATDGTNVYAMVGTGNLVAYDFAGNRKWARDLAADFGSFSIMWIYGSSPLLWNGRLYIQVLQRTPVPEDYTHAPGAVRTRDSYLLCLDAATGTNIFRQIRPTEAQLESMESYCTPYPCKTKAGLQILVFGADHLTGHDPMTGAELWRSQTFNSQHDGYWRIVPTPIYAGGHIIACGPKRDPVVGIRDQDLKGSLPESSISWRLTDFPTDCSSPLLYREVLYVLDGDRQRLTALNPASGEKLGQIALGVHDIFRASPTGADGRIYCVSETGTVIVVEAGKEMKILSTIRMGESPVRSSVVAAQGALFIRTARNLYCVPGPGFIAKQ